MKNVTRFLIWIPGALILAYLVVELGTAQNQETFIYLEPEQEIDDEALATVLNGRKIADLAGDRAAQVWIADSASVDDAELELDGIDGLNFQELRGDYRNLFHGVEVATLDAGGLEQFAALADLPTTISVHATRITIPPLQQLALTKGFAMEPGAADAGAIRLEIDESTTVVATRTSMDQYENGYIVWTGVIEGDPSGHVMLIYEEDHLTGSVATGDAIYEIRDLGNGQHAFVKQDSSRFPPDHDPDSPSPPGPDAAIQPLNDVQLAAAAAAPDPPVTAKIDVLIVFTQEAEARVRASSRTKERFAFDAVQSANQTLVKSNIGAKLELVGTQATLVNPVDNSGDLVEDVRQLADPFGNSWLEVHELRRAAAADVVILIATKGVQCGRARRIGASPDTAFAIVRYKCAPHYPYTVAHEIGHLLGARHDDDQGDSPYLFGHGHIGGAYEWATVMGNRATCDCRRHVIWSDRERVYLDAKAGDDDSHNVEVWRRSASTVAAFR